MSYNRLHYPSHLTIICWTTAIAFYISADVMDGMCCTVDTVITIIIIIIIIINSSSSRRGSGGSSRGDICMMS